MDKDQNSILKRPTYYDTLNLEEEEKDEVLSLINQSTGPSMVNFDFKKF